MPGLHDWFDTPLGRYLLEREQTCVDQMVSDVFGFNAMQLGMPERDFLRANRIPFRFAAAREKGAALNTDLCYLPLASQSIDLIVLPHVLEFDSNPHQILREVERVLMPEGHVVISGFNPWSLWGLWRVLRKTRREYPWCGKFISLPRMKDWLALLGMEVTAGRLCCYAPPVNRAGWPEKFRFMEPAGDRWWAMGGGAYFLQAKKRVHSMRLIAPRWNETLAPAKSMAPVAQKVAEFDTAMSKKSN
jgi:SAM-dependent methyltransferase